ncbi:ACRO protein, partial [Sterrhoptilus dennistouni]|nr:ACRO protein [Sterrhoptilus dennistouni]
WPGIVSIQVTLENGTWHMCSGALIHPQWAVTVAQCFRGDGAISVYKVVIGATDLAQPGPKAELRHIQRVLKHQSYVEATARNNIALVELDQPVECSDYIQLGCVPDSSLESCHSPSVCPCPPSPSSSPCHPEVCLCPPAAPDPSLLAQGDIGGPLICKDHVGDYFWLVGLASWGKGCTGEKRPGVFTSTQHFRGWIQVQLGLVSSNP